MASNQGDSISNTVEKSHEINPIKPKSLLPLRMMEEEVWFSGSELKTDNSSSEEEQIGDEISAENRIKGARRKTKFMCNSRRNRTQILRESRHHLNETITETVQTMEEVSSSSTSEMSIKKLSSENGTTINSLDKMLKKCENTSKKFLKLSSNKADDEKTQLQKIKCLEERIEKAEQVYMNARHETDRLVEQMENILRDVSQLPGANWEFFNGITRKWIDCLSRPGSKSEITSQGSILPFEYDKHNIEKNQLEKSRHLANKSKCRNRKLIKIRKGTNYNIVLRNIKLCPRTRFKQDIKTPDLSEYEQTRLNEILNQTADNDDCMGYRLRAGEISRVLQISNQLRSASNSNISTHDSSLGDNRFETNNVDDEGSDNNDAEECEPAFGDSFYQCNSSTDSEKQKIFASHSNLSLTDSFEDYGSCDEATSDFASNRNLDRISD